VRFAVCTLALVIAAPIARADDHAADRVAVTLDAALAAAAKAPAAQIGHYDVVAAEANIAAATAWPDPGLHVGTNRLTAKAIIGATIPLPIFGTVGAAKRVAAADAEVVRSEADLGLRDLRHRVVIAWIDLLRAGDDVQASVVAAQQAADLETITKGRFAAGTGADVDVTVAGAARARADVAVAAARREQDAASAELAGLLGWDPAQPLRADGAPVIAPAAALPALQRRLAAHPERQAAEHRVEAAQAVVDEVRVQRWPALAVEGELDYDDRSMTEGQTAWDRTDAHVGLALDLPIFARIGDRERAARAAEAAEQTRLAALEAELGGRLVAAYDRWQAANERLAAMERDVIPAQEKAASLSMQAYREGARDLSSAVLAERDLASARAELNDARAQAALAYADLAVAIGDDVHAK
jgi:multidrug efflux system outer membrane protein